MGSTTDSYTLSRYRKKLGTMTSQEAVAKAVELERQREFLPENDRQAATLLAQEKSYLEYAEALEHSENNS